jgi:hypothetical protein
LLQPDLPLGVKQRHIAPAQEERGDTQQPSGLDLFISSHHETPLRPLACDSAESASNLARVMIFYNLLTTKFEK